MAQVHFDLSVVTVVLNDNHGLEKTIKTIRTQEFLNIEHIIVDGGSEDGSQILASKHSTVYVESRADGGIYPAMQRGATVATGKYLIFCNAGDLLFGTEYLHGAIKHLEDSGSKWGYGPIIEHTQRNTFAWVSSNSEANPKSIIARKDFVPFPSFIINREQFNKVGGFSNLYRIAGDFELICKVASQSSPVVFTDPIAIFSAGGISYTKADLAWREELLIRKQILKFGFIQNLGEICRFWLRFTKWKFGKFLDKVDEFFGNSSTSWRDKRAQKVPTKYLPELIQ